MTRAAGRDSRPSAHPHLDAQQCAAIQRSRAVRDTLQRDLASRASIALLKRSIPNEISTTLPSTKKQGVE
jgi:hypothetical protein